MMYLYHFVDQLFVSLPIFVIEIALTVAMVGLFTKSLRHD